MRNRIKMVLPLVMLASLPALSFGQRASSLGGSVGGMRMGQPRAGAEGGMGRGDSGGMSGASGGIAGDGYESGEGGSEMGGSGATRESLIFNLDGKTYHATRVLLFQYVPHSFRPTAISNTSGDMGMPGGSGMKIPGGSGMGGPVGGYIDGPSTSSIPLTIRAYVFDKAKDNDRTRIELVVPFTAYSSLGYPGGDYSEGGYGVSGGGYPGGGYGVSGGGSSGGFSQGSSAGGIGGEGSYPGGMGSAYGGMGDGMGMSSEPIEMKSFGSLGNAKSKSVLKLPDTEIKLVSDIIRQTIWRADVVRELRNSKGQGETAPANEKLLKQLLAEQYDTQLARQEMEAESIKKRLDALQEELVRRRSAKDRVIEVQWGRLILDAQGLLNNEQEVNAR